MCFGKAVDFEDIFCSDLGYQEHDIGMWTSACCKEVRRVVSCRVVSLMHMLFA